MTAQNIIITNITFERGCVDRTDNYWETTAVAHTNVVNQWGKEVVGIGYENADGDKLQQVNEAIKDAYETADLYLNVWGSGSIKE